MQNAAVLLDDIMEDLDVILHNWKNQNPQSNGNQLAALSQETGDLLRDDSAWLKEVLGKKYKL